MKLNQRQKDIIDLVNIKQKLSVKFLSEKLYFSEMTIRRDLTKLENLGYLKRYYGGAIALSQTVQYPIDQRMHINENNKKEIAQYAKKHLEDNQIIFLPGCSTSAYLLPFLKNYKNLNIITNSILFLTVLSEMNIKCTICGGEYFAADKALFGRAAENFLRSINYDISFLGCDGIDNDGTISVLREDAAELVKIGVSNSKKIIIIADSTKKGMKYTYNICNTKDTDDIIMI